LTTTDASTPGVLKADNPNNRQVTPASQVEPEPAARQLAAMVATCARQMRHDPVGSADHPRDVMAAHGTTDLVDGGRRLAGLHLAVADAGWKDLNMESLHEVGPVDVSPRSRS
jgi:hypothetical protein